MPSIKHDVPNEFIRLAERIGISPERFAELLCATAVEINPHSVTIIARLSDEAERVFEQLPLV